MVDVAEKVSFLQKLRQGLRKLHFFALLFWGTWSYLAAYQLLDFLFSQSDQMDIFLDWHTALSDLLAICGMVIAYRFLKLPEKKGRFWIFWIWNILPMLFFGICALAFFDSIFSFGGMFPGLAALWTWIDLIIETAITVILGAGTLIWYFLEQKKGRLQTACRYVRGKKLPVCMDVLNFLAFLLLVGTIVVQIFITAGVMGSKLAENEQEKANLAFAQSFYQQHPEMDEDTLLDEDFFYAYASESLALHPKWREEMTASSNSLSAGMSESSWEAIVSGSEQLTELLQTAEMGSGVDIINAHVTYDAKKKEVNCYYEMTLIRDNAYEYYWVVVSTDEHLQKTIHYEEE